MIKKILAGSALLLLPSIATAADLPRRSMAVAPAPAYAPIFTWTGFYAGANAGYGWGKSKFSGTAAGSANVDGFLVGGASLKPEFAQIVAAIAAAKASARF